MFRFAAGVQKVKTYAFSVRQTYSDGSVVDWNGPESSDTPTPEVKSLSSLEEEAPRRSGSSRSSWPPRRC